MPGDWNEDTKPKDTAEETKGSLGQEGMRSMQGEAPVGQDAQVAEKPDESLQLEPDKYSDLTYDPDNYEYKKGSPHADYQLSKDVEAAKKQHELGEQANTADSLPDAISTTLAARKESNKGDEETPMDEYFYKKHGRAPYTEDAYPKDEE
jgi:hypothetical protein